MLRTLSPLLALMLIFNPTMVGVPEEAGENPDGYTIRPPIRISTDEDFTPDNGVVGGKGTANEPYQISGWHITPSLANAEPERTAISIGGGVRHSFFVIHGNYIELPGNLTIGIATSSPVGGIVRNNIVTTTGDQTFGLVLSTGAGLDNRQDPTQPLRVEGNRFIGRSDKSQIGIGMSGTAIAIDGNRFLDVDIAINIGASLTIGPMVIKINENDVEGAEWGTAAALAHGNTLNIPVIDAQNNYWGHPEGPTPTICSNTLGCPIFIGEEKGAYVAPNVLAYPYAEEPFYPED